MAGESAQDHLYKHYGDLSLQLVDEPTGGEGKGMTPKQADSFLRSLRPMERVRQTLAQAAKKVKPKS